MKIVVLVKEVPDTWGDRRFNLETGLTDRESSERVLDEIVERGLEFAISYAEQHDGVEVVALSMASEDATPSIRKALAMGADSGVLLADKELVGADLTLTAEVLAAALHRIGFDLIVTGDQSTDGSGGVLAAALAELLDIPQLTKLSSVELESDKISGTRTNGRVTLSLASPLPAIISVTERFPDGRFPNFKGIMAAKKKPLETLSLRDLGEVIETLGSPRSILTEISARPPRSAGIKIVDEGDAGQQLAEFLKKNQLV